MSLWSMVAELKDLVDDGELGDGSLHPDYVNCRCDACFVRNMFEHLSEDNDDEPGYDSDDENYECTTDEQRKRINFLYERECNDDNTPYDDFDEY